jgi:hypothetical protein
MSKSFEFFTKLLLLLLLFVITFLFKCVEGFSFVNAWVLFS